VVQKDTLLAVKGNLTFHGVTKPVAFAAVRKDVGTSTTVQGSFTVSLTEFGVERPSFMMVKTEDNLEIELKMVFKQ
jgi:polyisoprenoid-binding protein YceI